MSGPGLAGQALFRLATRLGFLIDRYPLSACDGRSYLGREGQRTVMTTESASAFHEWSMPGPHTA